MFGQFQEKNNGPKGPLKKKARSESKKPEEKNTGNENKGPEEKKSFEIYRTLAEIAINFSNCERDLEQASKN